MPVSVLRGRANTSGTHIRTTVASGTMRHDRTDARLEPLVIPDLSLQVDELDLQSVGPQFESHPVFPARTNTEFIEVRATRTS